MSQQEKPCGFCCGKTIILTEEDDWPACQACRLLPTAARLAAMLVHADRQEEDGHAFGAVWWRLLAYAHCMIQRGRAYPSYWNCLRFKADRGSWRDVRGSERPDLTIAIRRKATMLQCWYGSIYQAYGWNEGGWWYLGRSTYLMNRVLLAEAREVQKDCVAAVATRTAVTLAYVLAENQGDAS